MDTEEKIELIKRPPTEEILGEEDLKFLLEAEVPLKHYIGFEVSGLLHLGTAIMSSMKIRDFQKAGAKTTIFLADLHSWINNKLSGDLELIRDVARTYYKKGFEAAFKAVGVDASKVEFVMGSELYEKDPNYWNTVLEISKNVTLSRAKRSVSIAGREMGDSMPMAYLVYPLMQVADIFAQGVNLAHAGTDQRKAHVIAREVALKLNIEPLVFEGGKYKPVAVHHHILLGLQKPPIWPVDESKIREMWTAMKMSKSKPDSAVFINDEPEEIMRKILKAFCPERETKFNPILDWAKNIIFPVFDSLYIERPEKFGGDVEFFNYADLERAYAEGKIHPLDLKKAVAVKIVELLEPVRKEFQKPSAKKALEMLKEIRNKTTR